MSGILSDDLLDYYQAELSYLRREGSEFARKHPQVARRLELEGDESPDPHVERLIESFAFLTARIQRKLTDEFPEVSQALLGVLYPHFTAPVPSTTIARFEVDPSQGKLTTGHRIERETPLFAQTPGGLLCRFRTCYPVTLWPLAVTLARFESAGDFEGGGVETVLRVRLEDQGDPPCEVDSLRFYLNGEMRSAVALYELLFAHGVRVAVRPEGGEPVMLPPGSLRPVGFGRDEGVLPSPPHAHPAYRLLQEYFAVPRKYLFAEVANLRRVPRASAYDLLILLDRRPPEWLQVGRESLLLGCTPVVNLFRRTTEPLRLDHRRSEYRLVPDSRHERTTEVHSILKVSSSSDASAQEGTYEPFYSFSHGRRTRAYWSARRVPTGQREIPGTDVMLSFVDLDLGPATPPDTTVWAHTLCTNRRLAEQVKPGWFLQIEEAAPLHRIEVLHSPTRPLDPPLGGPTLWRLVSQLSLNHLSLTGPGALEPLRELLRLYAAFGPPACGDQVDGIVALDAERVALRAGEGAWRGVCRGTRVSLVFDEARFREHGAFVLASVLNHFLALYAGINSFTQLVARLSSQRDAEWKRWPPMTGEQPVL